jgi:RluA family pseudouridine synthase
MLSKKEIINILYEDDSIIVLNKPAGVLTIPDRYERGLTNLYDTLKTKYKVIFTVHRLDRDTSGVIVFAKDAGSHKHLNQQFQDLKVTKIYHAVVSGTVVQDELKIDIPLIPDTQKKGLMKPSSRGKESLTILKVIERFRIATLVELNLITGRHHQIRVHCSAIGHPLLVDEIYGNSSEFKLSSLKRRYNLKKDDVEMPIISRVSMHSFQLSFLHPKTSQYVSFEAPEARDFQALVQVLRKYSGIRQSFVVSH